MLKQYHKITSAVVAIGLVVVVQAFASPLPVFRFLIPAVAGFVILVELYNFFYLREVGQWNFWKLVQHTLFFVAWFGVFTLLPNYFLRGVYLVLSLPVVYVLEYVIANFSEQMLINQTLLTGFGLFQTAWGLQFYYKLTEGYIFLLQFVALFLLVRASFELVPHSVRLKTISALAISLFMSQLHWALSFWPLHYSALALIMFCLFYALWTLYYYALFNILTAKRVQFYLSFAAVAIALIVIVTPWRILL